MKLYVSSVKYKPENLQWYKFMYVDMIPLYFYEIKEDVGVNILEENVNTQNTETWARKKRKTLSVFKNKQTPNQTNTKNSSKHKKTPKQTKPKTKHPTNQKK